MSNHLFFPIPQDNPMKHTGYIDLLIYKCDVATGSITILFTIIHYYSQSPVSTCTPPRLPLQPFALFQIDFRSELSSAKLLSTYYQSASSLTFREEEDKREEKPDSGRRERGETATSAFRAKQR